MNLLNYNPTESEKVRPRQVPVSRYEILHQRLKKKKEITSEIQKQLPNSGGIKNQKDIYS